MKNETQFQIAWARFDALRKNRPTSLKRAQVVEYHSILEALQEASGEDLAAFRIPDDQFARRITSIVPGTRRTPSRKSYSDDEYCNDNFFARQIEGVATYFQSPGARQVGTVEMQTGSDYWSMSDTELEVLARKYNIPPYSRSGERLENWYVDRDRIIDALVKRDNALRKGLPPPPPSNVINVGTMYGSSIQQGTENSLAIVDYKGSEAEIRNLLIQLRECLNELQLSAAARQQLEADAHTVEAQLASPHPKPMVVRECLHSIRNVLEGMAGSLLAAGLVTEIGKFLR